MGLFCCLAESEKFSTVDGYPSNREQKGLSKAETGQASGVAHVKGASPGPVDRKVSLLKDEQHRRAEESQQGHGAITVRPMDPASRSTGQEALLQLLSVLTSIEGGWWDHVERALAAAANHLSASHACIFVMSSDSSYASPLALVGPPAPPLCIGTPLPLLPAAAAAAAAGAGGPSCAAAALQLADKHGSAGGGGGSASQAILFVDADSAAGRSGGGGGGLPAASPPEWQHLAAAAEPPAGGVGTAPVAGPASSNCGGGGGVCRHFAAVAIPAGQRPLGALSLGAEGPGRPPSWTPEALHCTAAMMSAPLRVPQVDLAIRALSELSSAATIHQLVRTLLGAAAELVVAVTRIDTQARVALLQPDVEAAAVFQSAATDRLGPVVRRRLSEVLIVDTAAAGGGGGGLLGFLGGLLLGNGGRAPGGGPAAVRRSLGGTEALGGGGGGAAAVTPRTPSVGAVAGLHLGDHHRDSFARGAHCTTEEELSVCRGHSLPLKHTLLSEALAQATTGLCIADCNAYVQDSRVYPRDLAVSRGAAPAQSLALATCCHGGRPLLALYATYPSILPQALLQTVVQELGQLLRALTACVAAKVEGALAAEWAHLRHQLLESMRNRSLRSLGGVGGGSASDNAASSAAALGGGGANGAAGAAAAAGPPAGRTYNCDPPLGRPAANATNAVNCNGGSGGGSGNGGGGGGGTPLDSPPVGHLRSVPSTGYLQTLPSGGGGGGSGSAGLLGLDRSRGAVNGGGGGGRDGRTSGRASFSLEAASSPRGSSKLAPLIATLHDRLKAAQAEQMANCRAAVRIEDLESIRVLEQIGRGGYGVVYRGLYHGSEVAIKVIQEAEVAASGDGGGGGPLRRLNSVALEAKHLHDAIELVASVGMGGHPNIVQVLTFFTDVRVLAGDTPVHALNRRLSGLDGVAEGLRLTRMPSTACDPAAASAANPTAAASPAAGEPPPGGGGGGGKGGGGGQGGGEGPVPRGAGGVIVLVQEFCDAGTLKNAINQRAFYRNATPPGVGLEDRQSRVHLQLNLKAVYSTLLEIALALRHMHGLHLVHCDLKPQNVLLKSSPRDPRGFTAKLSDFGLAKMMAHDEQGRLVIDEAVGSGTLTHMAPESLAGQTQLNASIDMFAFGILMWQMVCGTRLYQGLTTKQIIRGVVREGLRPSFPAWVPGEYRRLAERCWHASPPERPTAGAVVSELEAMVEAYSRAAASAASAAAAAAAASWRPVRVSSHDPNGGGGAAAAAAAGPVASGAADSPGSGRHLHHLQPHQLQQLQLQQRQQHAAAVTAVTAVRLHSPPAAAAHPQQHLPARPHHPQHPAQHAQHAQHRAAAAAAASGLASPGGPGAVAARAGSQTGIGAPGVMTPTSPGGLVPGGRFII